MRFARIPALSGALAIVAAAAGCGESPPANPLAERGRQVYLSQCIACHSPDPAQPGAVGPAVKGAARALLETKVLQGTYPPGYAPKRPTKVMSAQPGLAPEIGALAAYLK
ncbi:MAG: c-type cytochrome [Candidatus Rokuibacteriota bacterium]